jgi:hypothetical protein
VAVVVDDDLSDVSLGHKIIVYVAEVVVDDGLKASWGGGGNCSDGRHNGSSFHSVVASGVTLGSSRDDDSGGLDISSWLNDRSSASTGVRGGGDREWEGDGGGLNDSGVALTRLKSLRRSRSNDLDGRDSGSDGWDRNRDSLSSLVHHNWGRGDSRSCSN